MEFRQACICQHVMGSNPAYITQFQDGYFCLDYKLKKTGVAQGQRAGLITPRTLDRNESPVSTTGTYCSTSTLPLNYRQRGHRGQRHCVSQHVPYITSHRCIKALEHKNRHGAEAARGAHNSEDTRSKRVVGISLHSSVGRAHGC